MADKRFCGKGQTFFTAAHVCPSAGSRRQHPSYWAPVGEPSAAAAADWIAPGFRFGNPDLSYPIVYPRITGSMTIVLRQKQTYKIVTCIAFFNQAKSMDLRFVTFQIWRHAVDRIPRGSAHKALRGTIFHPQISSPCLWLRFDCYVQNTLGHTVDNLRILQPRTLILTPNRFRWLFSPCRCRMYRRSSNFFCPP